MPELPIHLVDVFAEQRYAGNQLAVVRDADGLDPETMQYIAREMNFSETTFVTGDEPTETGYPVHIFTPAAEIPFAGHPTLGTTYVLRESVASGEPDEVVLDLAAGSISVHVETDGEGTERYWMEQQPPTFGPIVERKRAVDVVGLSEDQLDAEHKPQVVSTGLPTLIVPLRSLEAVRAARTNAEPYEAFVAEHEARNVLVFAAETVEPANDLHVRVFAEALGVPEDPATGSSNGCLAGYLAKNRYFGSPTIELTVEQGHEVDRPSEIGIRASADAAEVAVSVGGKVIQVATGELV